MNEYKPNSHKYHSEKKDETAVGEKRVAKPVVSSAVQTKKKSGIASIAKTFLAEDLADVGAYLWAERIVPAIKKTLVNIGTDAVNMIFLGKNAASSSSSTQSGPKVSYRSYYDEPKRNEIPQATNRFDYGQLEFKSRGDAEAVRVEMGHICHRWGYVRVSDMFDLANLVPPVSSFKYGWTDVSRAVVRGSGDSYYIELPKAMPID